jgi:DNA-binding NarL/FixJ family response regulator
MSPQIARMLVRSVPNRRTNDDLLKQLTPREREILDLLAAGFRYKEIGDKLFLGIETVRTYIRNIYSKLQVHSRTDAINKLYER